MTEEEYIRLKNLLDTVIEQQAVSAEKQAQQDERNAKTDERIARNAEAIAALLTLAEIHEQEMTAQFKETDERINALVNIVERHISSS